MDQFFQILRKIQKKERNNSSLARVEDNFYNKIQKYLKELRTSAMNDPFSDEYNLLKDTQRIATEICERREHKITDAAVVNIHRSYHLFTGKPQFDLVDTTPLNLTPEEEIFYFSLIGSLKDHRVNISLDKLSSDDLQIKKPSGKSDGDNSSFKNNDSIGKSISKESVDVSDKLSDKGLSIKKSSEKTNDEYSFKNDDSLGKDISKESSVLDNLDKIKNAKVISNEKVESIEKQILKSKKKSIKEDISNIFYDANDQFVDFESNVKSKDEEKETILIFDNLNSIIGIDEKIYGPFRPQDLVVMPRINAKIFVKNRKGRIIKM